MALVPGPVDAVVVGAGPNGLTAAATLARAGLSVRVYEAASTIGGGTRTEELTEPGFLHDVCSAVHPLAAGSPALRRLPLGEHGLEWVHADLPLAHPLPDGSAAVLDRSLEATAAALASDGEAYHRLLEPFHGRWWDLVPDLLRAPAVTWPRHPLLWARFGSEAIRPASWLTRRFHDERTGALFAGLAAHALAPLEAPFTGGVAVLLALAAHEGGWPIARGGSQAIASALGSYLSSLDVEILTGAPIRTLAELPPARAYLFDLMPRSLVALAGSALPPRYTRSLLRYRHGPGVVKVDYALDGPVPWIAEPARRAVTVHVGGPADEIGAALRAVDAGRRPEPPFLIVLQPGVADASRAPAGRQVLWVYAHVPSGWSGPLAEDIERQLERFAPGFRDLVIARSVMGPADLEARNANLVGGDIAGGAFRGRQALFRPVLSAVPYATPNPALYLCSSATPPGPGVHGMCGEWAARIALRRRFGIREIA